MTQRRQQSDHCAKCGNSGLSHLPIAHEVTFAPKFRIFYSHSAPGPGFHICISGVCPDGEHLHVRCRRCHAEWIAPCWDQSLGEPCTEPDSWTAWQAQLKAHADEINRAKWWEFWR